MTKWLSHPCMATPRLSISAPIASTSRGLPETLSCLELKGCFVRFRARRCEKKLLQSRREDLQQTAAQLCPNLGGIAGSDIRQLARLLLDGTDYRRVLVPKGNTHELRREVEILLSRRIKKVAAFGIDDMKRLPPLLKTPGCVSVLGSQIDDFLRCKVTHGSSIPAQVAKARLRGHIQS